MRLLHFGKQYDLVLTEYHDDPPPYAVFVQRRGPPNEEITFQDLQTRQGQSKPGYQKILSFGKQAQRHGLAYFWVSTCCIDKANSVELWETLKSMSNLLLNARRCYVHHAVLAGFLAVVALDLFGDSLVLQSRRQKQLEFFSPELESLKTRASLEQMIRKGIFLRFGQLPESSTLDFSINWGPMEPVSTDIDNRQNQIIPYTVKHLWQRANLSPWLSVRDNTPMRSPVRFELRILSSDRYKQSLRVKSGLTIPIIYDGAHYSAFEPTRIEILMLRRSQELRGARGLVSHPATYTNKVKIGDLKRVRTVVHKYLTRKMREESKAKIDRDTNPKLQDEGTISDTTSLMLLKSSRERLRLLTSSARDTPDYTTDYQEAITSGAPVSNNHVILANDLASSTSDEAEILFPNGPGHYPIPSPKSNADDFLFLIWRILDFWGIAFSSFGLMNLLISSPSSGWERIQWRCTCNTILWGDFPTDDSHTLAQLKEDLLKDLSLGSHISGTDDSNIETTENFTEAHNEQQLPGDQRPRHAGTTSHSTATSGSGSSSSFIGRQGSPFSPISQNSSSDQPSIPLSEVIVDRGKPVYFEVCTNNGNSAVGHFELDITRTATDGELFGKIWKIYNENRWFGLKRWFLLPCDVHFVLFSISTTKNARYSAGIHGKPAEFPPDAELENGRYVYQKPKIVMPSHLFIHYLHRGRSNNADEHPGTSWLKRLPKKLNESMLAVQATEASPDSDLVFGWGVHILDGPNHAALGFLLAVGIAITFVISFLILGIEKTEEQAFGVGSYLIAIVVALMSALYFRLQDQ